LIGVKVNKEDGTDLLYLQVAAQIRRAIADGEAKPGERLPPARDLATVLGVNTNTVLRSLRLLQDEGLLELDADAESPSPEHPNAAPSSRRSGSWSSSLADRDTPSTNSSR
jgi:DNA-binding transcriptional regulator YhcF (GntR family)